MAETRRYEVKIVHFYKFLNIFAVGATFPKLKIRNQLLDNKMEHSYKKRPKTIPIFIFKTKLYLIKFINLFISSLTIHLTCKLNDKISGGKWKD